MKNKKVLIHTIVFSPDGVSTAYLYNDIALRFKDAGYDVAVLTTTPHYNVLGDSLKKQPMKKKLFGLYLESEYNGIKVLHVPQKKFQSSTLRIMGFLYWHFLSFFLGLFERQVDVILSPSPPLTIGIINIVLSKIKGCKVIYNVQEIYPDFLIERVGQKSKLIINCLKWVERFVYNNSDAVTTIDEVFFNIIVKRFKDSRKLHVIPNFVDTGLYKPLAFHDIRLDPVLFPSNEKLKVMYAGNIGLAQDWQPLVQSAIQLLDDPIVFYVIGEGVMKEFIIKKKEEHNLENIHILPYQPRERMPELLAYSDLQFIFMSKEMEQLGFPSKVYTIMACAKPLLVCSGDNTPIFNFLKNLGCAYLIPEIALAQKVDKIVSILREANRKELKMKGLIGPSFIEREYSSRAVTGKYIRLVDRLIAK